VLLVVVVVVVMAASGCRSNRSSSYSGYPTINKTKYLMILGIHKSIKIEFIIKLNKDKLGNACCC
jgi:hypothetical protein